MVGEETDFGLKLCVGVTAHRDLVDDEVAGLESAVRHFFENLAREFPGLPLALLSPLAEGGDQLVARVALDLGLPLIAVLPMSRSEYETDFEPGPPRDEFRRLLARADRVIELPPAPGSDGPPYRGAARQTQYCQLGVFLSNHSQVLLALWDGKPGSEPGGTADVVGYHLTAIMAGFEADQFPSSILAENENDLVYHVACSRARAGGEPAAGLHALQAAWFCSRVDGRSKTMPAEYRLAFERLQVFVKDWRDKHGSPGAAGEDLLAGAPPFAVPSGARITNQLFQVADGLAIHYQRRVHQALRAVHWLAALMGLVFLYYTELDGPSLLVLAFLLLFFGGVLLHAIGDRREWHRKYLDYRALAEGLRVQFYWNLAGVVESRSVEFAYDNFLQQQDVDLGWIRHVMRSASLLRARGEPPDPRWVEWVVGEWVGDAAGHGGQSAYYSRKERENSVRHRRTSLLGNLALWTGISAALLLFLLGDRAGDATRRLLLVLMAALPLIAGIRDAYSHKRAEKELIKQYAFMSRVFGRARALLEGSRDLAFRRRVLRALGEAALEEDAEWLLMHRERPLEHGRL